MTTIAVPINKTTYTQLTTAADFVVQNPSSSAVAMIVADAQPADDAAFFMRIEGSKGLTSAVVTGTVWGKALYHETQDMSVTE